MTPVGSNAKNYNAVEVSQYGEIKYNYELFRYDVVKNSNKKIDCNIVVMEINSLYNYTAKIYVLSDFYKIYCKIFDKHF